MDHRKKQRIVILGLILWAVLIVSVRLLAWPAALQKPIEPIEPSITWSEARLKVILPAGGNRSIDLTLTSSRDLQNVVIESVPTISAFLSVQPNSFSIVPAGRPQSVHFVFAIPSGTSPGTYEGVVRVKQASATVPRPLRIVIKVWSTYVDPGLGVQFLVPSTMSVEPVSNARGSTIYLRDTSEEYPNGITITKYNRSLESIIGDIASALSVVNRTQQAIGGQVWIIYTFKENLTSMQFVDAFTTFNGAVYQVGGRSNPAVTSTLPEVLSTFTFF